MTNKTCANCSVKHGPDDMFCENCGYDFITGSLPAGSEAAAPAVAPRPAAPSVLGLSTEPNAESGEGALGESAPAALAPSESAVAEVPRTKLSLAVDKSFFDEVVNDGEIDFPDPVPADQELELAGSELHIGRTSDSRAIHPDIDVAEMTGDQAVSSRHAVLRVANDGGYTIVDVGSTNGTFVEAVDSDAIDHGVPVAVKPGTAMYVGAWTRLMIIE